MRRNKNHWSQELPSGEHKTKHGWIKVGDKGRVTGATRKEVRDTYKKLG